MTTFVSWFPMFSVSLRDRNKRETLRAVNWVENNGGTLQTMAVILGNGRSILGAVTGRKLGGW